VTKLEEELHSLAMALKKVAYPVILAGAEPDKRLLRAMGIHQPQVHMEFTSLTT
jgi:hypothetical protein